MRRRRWMLLAAAPVVLGVAHFAYWHTVQRDLLAGYAAWVADMEASGWTVHGETSSGGGWPLSAEVRVSNVVMTGGTALIQGGLVWRSPHMALRIGLLDPRHLEVVAEGQQMLRVGDSVVVTWQADPLRATLLLSPDGPAQSADVLIQHLTVDLPPQKAAPGRLTVGLLQGHADLLGHPGGGAFSLSAEAIDLPSIIKWPLGPRISSVALQGLISGDLGQGGAAADRAAAWRDSGGSVEIDRMALGWGPLGVSATATLALDEQLQPMGTGTARLVGYAAALDALAANGTLSRSAVIAAKAVLSLLAPAPGDGDGEPAEVDVPLTLQYRTLSMRQVPLLRLPELDWPQR